MVSNQILQGVLNGIKDATDAELALFDIMGNSIVATEGFSLGSTDQLQAFIVGNEEMKNCGDVVFAAVKDQNRVENVLAVMSSQCSEIVAKMAALQVQTLNVAYKERLDKDTFIKDVLLDNLLLVDIYNRAKKFHIPTNAKRVVYLLYAAPDNEKATLENIEGLFAENENDFVTAIDENSIIVVKQLDAADSYKEAEKVANQILAAIDDDGKSSISYGTIVDELKDVSRSFKEAHMATDVGRIFSPEKNVVAYSSLGIGRLIYQLPLPLCKMFIKEIFTTKTPDKFDEETVQTINKFFENNLNVSETSRQLYIHRNTLVYRLDKLQKSTGLDLRVFEDAITFKIALMVVRYMKYMETLDY